VQFLHDHSNSIAIVELSDDATNFITSAALLPAVSLSTTFLLDRAGVVDADAATTRVTVLLLPAVVFVDNGVTVIGRKNDEIEVFLAPSVQAPVDTLPS